MKHRSQIMVLAVVLLMVLITGPVLAGTPEEEAQQAAKSWLNLVDTGKYVESWKSAATLLKEKTSMDKWVKDFGVEHQKLGKVLSRKLKSAVYTKKLKDAPGIEGVVIKFDSSFPKMQQAIETIIPTREADGKWRVAGYWIESPPEKK